MKYRIKEIASFSIAALLIVFMFYVLSNGTTEWYKACIILLLFCGFYVAMRD